tara:strand:- start:64 stop:378 length:315 start_codon:yes stop_codon:yes gene_type:complete
MVASLNETEQMTNLENMTENMTENMPELVKNSVGGKKKRKRSSKSKVTRSTKKRGTKRKGTKRKGTRKKGPSKWIMHVKAFCRKTGKNFPQALKDPLCRKTFKN